jgi:hypothetical protein
MKFNQTISDKVGIIQCNLADIEPVVTCEFTIYEKPKNPKH